MDDISQIRFVPEKYKTEELYTYVGYNGVEFQVVKYIPMDKMTQKICINIAANTRFTYFGFDKREDRGLKKKLEIIPKQYQNADVYYYLIEIVL